MKHPVEIKKVEMGYHVISNFVWSIVIFYIFKLADYYVPYNIILIIIIMRMLLAVGLFSVSRKLFEYGQRFSKSQRKHEE